VAATSALCPGVAVLGAKRPQDKAWTFIVASLWLVLVLPALQAIVFAYGSELELHWAWRYFLLLVLIAGWSNYVLTRFWLAACLIAAAQTVLLGHHLPGIGVDFGGGSVPIALLILATASVLVWLQTRRQSINGLDRVWRDFRDAFGVVWGLRIMERVNSLATQQKWTRSLQWSGFVTAPEIPESTTAGKERPAKGPAESLTEESLTEDKQIEQCLRTLLRRFVHPEWINRRLNRK
jgi:hypothetical protein